MEEIKKNEVEGEGKKGVENLESITLKNCRIFKGIGKNDIPYFYIGKKVQEKVGEKYEDTKDENGKPIYATMYLHFNTKCIEGHKLDFSKIERNDYTDFDYVLGYFVGYKSKDSGNQFTIRINDFKLK